MLYSKFPRIIQYEPNLLHLSHSITHIMDPIVRPII